MRRLGRHVRSRMVSGLLVVLPLGATYLIIRFLFELIDPPLSRIVVEASGREIPGVGIATFLVAIYVAGLIGSYVIGRRFIAVGHRIADLIPVVRPIYRTARQTVDALSATKWNEQYSRVVLLDYPKDGVKSLGFVTAAYKDGRGASMVAVFIPTTPLPSSGFLALVPEEKIIFTRLSVDEAMKIVLSGGILTPPIIQEDRNDFDKRQGSETDVYRETSNH